MILTGFLVAFLDGLTVFLNVKERDTWALGQVRQSVLLEGLSALTVGITILMFIEYTWWMLVPSILGCMVGRYLAWRL